MSSTLIWGVIAVSIGASIGSVVWWARLPFPEIAVSEATWLTFNGAPYYAWSEANPGDGWFMVQRREDGDYHMSFLTRGAARRFRERWLKGVPNQASLTQRSRSGTGAKPR
jgi:hypothetical protein